MQPVTALPYNNFDLEEGHLGEGARKKLPFTLHDVFQTPPPINKISEEEQTPIEGIINLNNKEIFSNQSRHSFRTKGFETLAYNTQDLMLSAVESPQKANIPALCKEPALLSTFEEIPFDQILKNIQLPRLEDLDPAIVLVSDSEPTITQSFAVCMIPETIIIKNNEISIVKYTVDTAVNELPLMNSSQSDLMECPDGSLDSSVATSYDSLLDDSLLGDLLLDQSEGNYTNCQLSSDTCSQKCVDCQNYNNTRNKCNLYHEERNNRAQQEMMNNNFHDKSYELILLVDAEEKAKYLRPVRRIRGDRPERIHFTQTYDHVEEPYIECNDPEEQYSYLQKHIQKFSPYENIQFRVKDGVTYYFATRPTLLPEWLEYVSYQTEVDIQMLPEQMGETIRFFHFLEQQTAMDTFEISYLNNERFINFTRNLGEVTPGWIKFHGFHNDQEHCQEAVLLKSREGGETKM